MVKVVLIKGQDCPFDEILNMKALNTLSVLEKLKDIKIFTSLDFQRIFEINYEAAKKAIFRYKKAGVLTKARRGLYFLTNKPPHEFEIANKLYQPSYISFETALSFYGIIPETIYEVISATSRISRQFIVDNLKFSYRKIKKECFFGYRPQKIQGRIILIAEPEKALADLLYLAALKRESFNYERVNLRKIKKRKLMKYTQAFKNKKLLELVKNF